jgi:hypothetical protein
MAVMRMRRVKRGRRIIDGNDRIVEFGSCC